MTTQRETWSAPAFEETTLGFEVTAYTNDFEMPD